MFDISLPVSWPGSGSKHDFQQLLIDVSPPTGVVLLCLRHGFPYFARDRVLSMAPCNYLKVFHFVSLNISTPF